MSDEPREPGDRGEQKPSDEERAAESSGAPDQPPAPSTWAGRTRAGAEGGDRESGGKDVAKDESEGGLTDDFDAVERDMSNDLDGLDSAERDERARADHPVPSDADPDAAPAAEQSPDAADEQPDPPDEFAFDEDEGDVERVGDGVSPEEADDAAEVPSAEVSPEVAAAAAAGETIEADTLSIADREAAREAALAGVRARTQQHELEPSQRTAKAPAVAAATAAGAARQKEPVPADEPGGVGGAGEPPKRRGVGWRFVAAASLIIMSIAASTAVYALLFLSDFAEGIGHNEKFASIKQQLAGVDGGGPQTIMFLGSDSRAKNPNEIKKGEDPGRSDTTLLARIDPDKNTINLLSLPRDLKVNIPGYGVDKLNAAYADGGQDLTLKTVKNLLSTRGNPFEVNHVVNIDFDGFYDAVNAIDCVYIDVDRHYYNSNEGVDPSEYYDEIDVPAGYQRLCGYNALNYVRYRHEDNDLVRAARQQDFVRELRQRIPPEKVFDQSLRNIFIKYTTSDISDANSLLEVLKTLFGARGAPVRQIQFEGDIGDATSTYVTATSKQIQDVREQFLSTAPAPPAPSSESKGGSKKKSSSKQKSSAKKVDPAAAGTVDISVGAEEKARQFLQKKATDFPVFYPTQGLASSTLSDDSRAYGYAGPEEKEIYRGYKFVFAFQSPGYEAYYGVEGTNWKDPPILDNPSETRTIDGRDYELFYDGGKLRLVGFKTSKGAYWVSNTLTKLLTEPQMLAIAESMRELKK